MQDRSLYIGVPSAGTTLQTFKADFADFKRAMIKVQDWFRDNTSINVEFISGPWVDPEALRKVVKPGPRKKRGTKPLQVNLSSRASRPKKRAARGKRKKGARRR